MTACERCGRDDVEVNLLDATGEWLCLRCAEPHLLRAPDETSVSGRGVPARDLRATDEANASDPFSRSADRCLAGLRRHGCNYRANVLGDDGVRTWRADCPLHPDAAPGLSLALLERRDGEVVLACALGCPEWVLRSLLDPDPERDRVAAARAAVLLWAQSYGKEAA
jgi:hypothetical protein